MDARVLTAKLADLGPALDERGRRIAHAAESLDRGSTFGAPFRTQNIHGWPMLCPCGADTFPDGRPILSGWYAYAHTEAFPSIMPYFDPVPALETRTMSVFAGSEPVSMAPVRFAETDNLKDAGSAERPDSRIFTPGFGLAAVVLALGGAVAYRRSSRS